MRPGRMRRADAVDVRNYGIDPGEYEFEVNFGRFMQNSSQNKSRWPSLKAIGCEVINEKVRGWEAISDKKKDA